MRHRYGEATWHLRLKVAWWALCGRPIVAFGQWKDILPVPLEGRSLVVGNRIRMTGPVVHKNAVFDNGRTWGIKL